MNINHVHAAFLSLFFKTANLSKEPGRRGKLKNITSAGVEGQTKLTIVSYERKKKSVCVYRVKTQRGVVQFTRCLEREEVSVNV